MGKKSIRSVARVTVGTGMLVLAALWSGCTSLPHFQPTPAVSPEIGAKTGVAMDTEAGTRPPEPTESFTSPLMYELLLGEIAGQRMQMDTALESYMSAAQATRDPRVAERALRIAVYTKQHDRALQAARRWVELDSENPEALQTLVIMELQDSREGAQARALEQLERIINLDGESSDNYDRVVGALVRVPDQELAMGVMAQLLERHSGEAAAHFARSRLAANYGQWDQALSSVERAIVLRGYWAQAEIARAEILLKLDRRELARKKLLAAVKRHPRNADLRLAYARLLVADDELKEADRQFRKLAKLQPENPEVLFSLALLALESDQLFEAEKYLLRLDSMGHRQQDVRYYLGRIAERQNKPEDAMEWYSQVTQGPHWLEARVHSSRLQAQGGDVEGAQAELRKLRENHSQYTVDLVLAEGAILTEQQRNQEAFDLYSQYIDQQPDSTELRYVRALVAEKLDHLDIAETDLLNILQREPNNGAALNALGYTLVDRTDRLVEAEGYIVKAMDLLPDDPAVIDSMGWLQYRMGNLEAAVNYLQRALEISDDGEIAAHLGEVLWQKGDQYQAQKVWEKARSDHPDNPVLQEIIKRFLP